MHLTKIAYRAQSLEDLQGWFAGDSAERKLTTRYLPKRYEELTGGSLFWILRHLLVARSPILRFEEADGGKTHIVISTRLVLVQPTPRRAHQGWRYLEAKDAPPDLGSESAVGDALPGELVSELAKLGLV